MRKRFTLFTILLSLSVLNNSCGFIDPMTQAQNCSKRGKFEKAITILEKELQSKPNSVPVKTLLAQAYSDYGLVLCQDENKPPRVKYPMAKENFAMALAINPNLEDAKEMYKMIEQIQAAMKSRKTN